MATDMRTQVPCTAIGCRNICTTPKSWFCSKHHSMVDKGNQMMMDRARRHCFYNVFSIRTYAGCVVQAIEDLAWEEEINVESYDVRQVVNYNLNRCTPMAPKLKPGEEPMGMRTQALGPLDGFTRFI